MTVETHSTGSMLDSNMVSKPKMRLIVAARASAVCHFPENSPFLDKEAQMVSGQKEEK